MALETIGWIILGAFLGGLLVVLLAWLKIGGLRRSMNLKDDKIRLLERQLEIASKMREEEID